MPRARINTFIAAILSILLHMGLLAIWTGQVRFSKPSIAAASIPLRVSLFVESSEREKSVRTTSRAQSIPQKTLASMAAPPPPTAQEWQLASTYKLKNSKRYRYNWGQQVRSMMGTAVEGPQQGYVRFRIEIAPEGKVTKVTTLWTTSKIAEKLARRAIQSLPQLPPTPTGLPLIFERTIAFEPFETGVPPLYKYDCLPDPPKFSNPFVWDGLSPQAALQAVDKNDQSIKATSAAEDCPNDTQKDSIEAEAADMERQIAMWGRRDFIRH